MLKPMLVKFIAEKAKKFGIPENVLISTYRLYKKYATNAGDLYALLKIFGFIVDKRSFRYLIKSIKDRDKKLKEE